MIISLTYHHQTYTADLSQPIDISIPLKHGVENPNCFHAPVPSFLPVQDGDFTGDTQQGGVVNFFNVQINPHGNGTHTECVGHISKERLYINDCLQQFHSIGFLISIEPQKQTGDLVITKELLMEKLEVQNSKCETLVVRTLPNSNAKLTQNYSDTNPPYFTTDAMQHIVDLGIIHLVVDLPSVDREKDEGKLAAHHIFWQYPHATRTHATITEMVYVPNEIIDGLYLVNHQIMPIELDASSSKLILFQLNRV
jgi:arylformamidase